jgi:protein-arginine kinase activator protein McsA
MGKSPCRAGGRLAGVQPAGDRAAAMFGTPQERSRRMVLLRKQLAEAIAAEQYERAASLRDELRRLGTSASEGAR